MTPQSRRRTAGFLRWISALATLVAVLLLFRAPLARVLPGLDRGLAATGLDSAFRLGPAPGFNLRADSVPSGAELWIGGELKGTLPMLGNVICRSGDSVELEVRLDGYEPWRRELECREGGQLEVTARLKRAR
jgi:hypothetical protein